MQFVFILYSEIELLNDPPLPVQFYCFKECHCLGVCC